MTTSPYLSLNGTSDYISVPSFTFDEVVFDINLTWRTSGAWSCLVYQSSTSNLEINTSGGQSSSGYNEPIIDGTPKYSLGTNSTEHIIDLKKTSATTLPSYLFSKNATGDFSQTLVYDVKFYNAGVIVCHYDMSTGTVNDQSGNGYNATLVGGTWVGGSLGTTYIGSGTATGKSNLTSNETLILSEHRTVAGKSNLSSSEHAILSEHGTITGQSNNTSNETFVGTTGTTYNASGTVSGKSNLTSSETLILKSTGNAQGQSTLTSNEHEILSASGTIQGSSSLQSNETLIQHTGTIYSASGTVTGQSNASSHETMSLSANGEVKGQSSLTSNEKVIFFVTGISQGQSSLKSNEKLISVKQIISRVTLQGSRELHVILEGNRELHVILKGGVDVPAENQNLTLEAGTDKIIDIPNIVDSTSPLDLTTCLEVHYQAKSGSTVITKDLTNGITVTSPTDLSISLLPADSHGLSGFFKHEVWCVDSNGKKSLLTKGNLIIKSSYADVN